MARAWYAQAKHRPMPTHNSKMWESNVGGVRTTTSAHSMRYSVDAGTCRAVYGSTDNAKLEHGNDTLCKVVPDSTGHNLVLATADIRNDTDHFTETVVDVDRFIERAIARGMSVRDYFAMMGVTIPNA